ncbi:MAG: hypothetical protein H8Z69_00230 [Nanohaloarchaea archaeon]|nr:hypothetical protein [Candidatus Nanohaloarchaea archaeon]
MTHEPWTRKLHRKVNKLEKKADSLPYKQEVESYTESLRGFRFQEGEEVSYRDNQYTVEERFSFSFAKKYQLSNEERTIKVPEDEIIL